MPGGRYRVGAWIRTENVTAGASGGATICVQYLQGGKWIGGEYPPGVVGTQDWTRVEMITTVPPEADQCQVTFYLRPRATGKAWLDEVTITAEKPRWTAYLIRPGRETIPPTDGRILLGSQADLPASVLGGAGGAGNLACRIEAVCGGRVVGDVVAPVRDGRIAADLGTLPEGAARLRLTLLDPKQRLTLGETAVSVTVAAPPAAVPVQACVIDERGRAIVAGKPFLPVGLYHHAFATREDLDLIAASPFNCIMPYNSLSLQFKESAKTGIAGISEVLDACQAKGVKIIFSIKDVYAGTTYAPTTVLGAEGEAAIVEKAVTTFRAHPALLAWYINDELPTSMLDRLTARRREVNRLDPFHPTWAVFCDFAEVPVYGPTCDIVGVDPYPVADATTRDMRRVKFGMDMTTRAVGTSAGMAAWVVPQIMNWGCYDEKAKNDRAYYQTKFRDPTEYEMIAMSLLCAIQGAKGFIYYSFSDLTGVIGASAKPDFERRWPEVCRMGAAVTALAPFLLSDTEGPAVTVRVEAGEVLAKAFQDDKGRLRVLVAGIGPGESKATLTVAGAAPLRSTYGKCVAAAAGQYRFQGTDICADILASE